MENSSIDETIDAGNSESKIPLILSVAAIVLGGLSFVFALNTKSTIKRTMEDIQKQVQVSVDRAEQASADARNVGNNGESLAALRADFENLKSNTEMGFKEANTAYAKVFAGVNAINERLGARRVQEQPRSGNTPATATPQSGDKYKVQQGDNPSKIAQKLGIRLNDLMNANPGLDPRKLRVGQELNVPAKK